MIRNDTPPLQEPALPRCEAAPRRTEPGEPRRIDSQALMGGQRELLIQHAQDTYRLRITAQGKLILTK